ncbi:hypothetical protein [Actinomadura fulvescens]
MTDRTYLGVWHKARAKALTPAEAASPLAETPYALRHAAVFTWLGAGVPPAQVAEWAGYSVAVLLRVYAKCVADQEDEAKRRITEANTSPAEEREVGRRRRGCRLGRTHVSDSAHRKSR